MLFKTDKALMSMYTRFYAATLINNPAREIM
jgi:hypothetical protein